MHRRATPGPHFILGQARPTGACRSTQTLGVTRNSSVNLVHRAIALRRSRPVVRGLSASAVPHVKAMPTLRARPEQLPFFSRSRTSLAIRLNKQHTLLATTVQRSFKLSWCRHWRAVEGEC